MPESEREPGDRKDFKAPGESYADGAEGRDPSGEETPRRGDGPRTPRVLVVDDYPDTRAILIDVLVNHGFRVETAEDGVEALRKARTWRPDVTILDLSMPGLDGFHVARRLKADAETRDLPLVAYTAHTDPEYRSRADEAGFETLLVKPTPPRELVGKVRALLPEAVRPVAQGAEPDPDDTWARLAGVRHAYGSALPLRVGRLAGTWQELRNAPEMDEVRLEAFALELHRLKGSGSTHGFPEVSRRAGKIEDALAAWRKRPGEGHRTEVDRRMDDLREAAARWGARS